MPYKRYTPSDTTASAAASGTQITTDAAIGGFPAIVGNGVRITVTFSMICVGSGGNAIGRIEVSTNGGAAWSLLGALTVTNAVLVGTNERVALGVLADLSQVRLRAHAQTTGGVSSAQVDIISWELAVLQGSGMIVEA